MIEICEDELHLLQHACGKIAAVPRDMSGFSEVQQRWLEHVKQVLSVAPELRRSLGEKHPQIWVGTSVTFVTFHSLGDIV